MATLRTAKLICVEIDTKNVGNSNKFYNITENADGSLSVLRGRVGSTEIAEKPNSSWTFDKLVASKIKKGYKDITSLKAVADSSTGSTDIFNNISDSAVIKILKFLMECSSNMVKTNYLVSTDDVTKAQVEEAQALINDSIQYLQVGGNKEALNKTLLKLYTILPRKMKNVKDYLVNSLNDQSDLETVKKLVESEQSLLSTLESQILTNSQTQNTSADGKNILEEMDTTMSLVTDAKEIAKIKNLVDTQNKDLIKNIYKVTNSTTQKRFDDHVSKAKNKKVELLFHGSRNCNFLGIIQKGLLIRPTNAIHTGSMFSDGLYFSDYSQKSLGYSSLSGSYWTKGDDKKGFLALFSVHMGRQKDIYQHDSSCYSLDKTTKKDGYDSVFAHKGTSLRNNEIIVYNSDQSTISYLIEMER